MGDELVEGTRLVVGVLMLGYASLSDIRTRTVTDAVWRMIGTVGFVLMIWEYLIPDFSIALLLSIVGVYLTLIDMMADRPEVYSKENGFNIRAAILPYSAWGMVIAGAIIDLEAVKIPFLSACVIAFVYIMYRFNMIAGGADAKALMSISILVPVMPILENIPILSSTDVNLTLFPFAILAFIYAGVTHIIPIFYLGIKNILKGDLKFPQLFLGYRMDVEQLQGAFVWPMETPEGRPTVRVKNLEDDVDPKDYLKAGKTKIWVTPQHPGIAYLLIGFILAFIIGNPFLLMTGGLS